MKELSSPFDARALRTSLGSFVTGVTVITTKDENGQLHGLTANSFNTVSIDPPLILWSQGKNAGSYHVFKSSKEFAISILAEDQTKISGKFATKSENKFDGVDIDQKFCHLPVIKNSSAWMHCKVVSQLDGGDHTIYIGEILKIAHSKKRPLVFGGGQYLLAQAHYDTLSHSENIPTGDIQQHFLKMANPKMRHLAEELDITVCASVWGSNGPTIISWEKGHTASLPSLPLGLVLPVTSSSIGKAFSAYLPEELIQPFLESEFSKNEFNPKLVSEALQQWKLELEEIKRSSISHSVSKFGNDDQTITTRSIVLKDQYDHPVLAVTAVIEDDISEEKDQEITERLLQLSKQICLKSTKN